MRKGLFSLFLIFSVLSSCVKDDIKNDEKELLSFSLKQANNQGYLYEDVNGVIEGNTIRISLPENIDFTNLVATYEFLGESVHLNGVEQFSGMTKNDYSQKQNYEIKAENGSTLVYQLVVDYLLASDLRFTTFSFKKEKNKGLSEDYELNFIEDTLRIQMKGINKTLIASFESTAKSVEVGVEIQVSSITEHDFSKPITYSLIYNEGFKKDYVIVVEWENTIPHIYIETEGAMPIVSTDDYLQAKLTIEGAGVYENFEAGTEIRGRGNTTWRRPKKPYRIKLNKKASILGLKPAKNWVLLANHFDETLMLNAVAMKIGGQLEIKYVNHIIPVELTVNGEFLGNYTLTEQIEVDENRVDIKNGGQLLEMDTYFKDDWKFKTSAYNLPIEIKYPKLKDFNAVDSALELSQIKSEFEEFENRVFSSDFPDSGYLDLFDQQALVDYLIVYMLTANAELNHPKSTYLYKEKDGKYALGPIWDFDWAFSFDESKKHFISSDEPLFWDNRNTVGTKFFRRLVSDPSTKKLLMERWSAYKATHLTELIVYIDTYALLIKDSQIRDRELWSIGSVDFKSDVIELKNWINNRANFLDGYIAGL